MGRVELEGNGRKGGSDVLGRDGRKGDVNVPEQMGTWNSKWTNLLRTIVEPQAP